MGTVISYLLLFISSNKMDYLKLVNKIRKVEGRQGISLAWLEIQQSEVHQVSNRSAFFVGLCYSTGCWTPLTLFDWWDMWALFNFPTLYWITKSSKKSVFVKQKTLLNGLGFFCFKQKYESLLRLSPLNVKINKS